MRRNAVEQIARNYRNAAINRCRRCDPCVWKLGPDRTPIEPAIRCDHGASAAPRPARDVSEPIHRPEDYL